MAVDADNVQEERILKRDQKLIVTIFALALIITALAAFEQAVISASLAETVRMQSYGWVLIWSAVFILLFGILWTRQ